HPSPYSNLTTLPTGISSPRTSFFLALSLHHALPIGEQVRDHAEIHALDVGHAQAFEVHPVVLARLRRRQRRARHPELRAAQCLCRVAVLDARKRHHQAFRGRPAPRAGDRGLGPVRAPQRPRLVAQDSALGVGERLQLHFPAHAEGAVDPAQKDRLLRGRRLGSHAVRGRGATPRRQAAAASAEAVLPALAALYRSATLSLSCAPCPTQYSPRSTFISTRFSAPAATGL